MPSYKLFYFQARGAAEVCRLLCEVAGQEYSDVRYSRDEWKIHKEEMPLKAMPVLEVDGKMVCQSNAISRYLAREFGLYGKTTLEQFLIDEIHEAAVELGQAFSKVFFASEEEKPKIIKPLLEETCPKIVNFFEKKLCQNNDGKGWMVGDKISLADIVVYNTISAFNQILNSRFSQGKTIDLVENNKTLKGLHDRVAAHPKIAAWVKRRPVTDF